MRPLTVEDGHLSTSTCCLNHLPTTLQREPSRGVDLQRTNRKNKIIYNNCSWSFFVLAVRSDPRQPGILPTCVASVTEASCRYSELPQPYSCPSADTARLQSPYVLICWTCTPASSPPTSVGAEDTLWCPRPEMLEGSKNWKASHQDTTRMFNKH